jgi:hypothetical protein
MKLSNNVIYFYTFEIERNRFIAIAVFAVRGGRRVGRYTKIYYTLKQ